MPRESVFGYMVRFENASDADAPALDVVVTHELDEELDLDTFELGDVGWADVIVDVPSGLQEHEVVVDQDTGEHCDTGSAGYCVRFHAALDHDTRTVTWTWTTELAAGGPITDPFAGFLPPRSEEHTSELHSLMRISYDVFCLKKKKELT